MGFKQLCFFPLVTNDPQILKVSLCVLFVVEYQSMWVRVANAPSTKRVGVFYVT
jgi:hypothetical protein